MTACKAESVAAARTRLGALFNAAPAGQTPDLERLLLETARAVPRNSSLLSVVATWLALYGEFVDGRRLAELIRLKLEPEHRPVMGLLLESVQQLEPRHRARLGDAVAQCEPSPEARPLFDAERRSTLRAELAGRRASPLSRKWGRWATDVELRKDVVRPADWVLAHNTELTARRAHEGGNVPPRSPPASRRARA